MYVFGVMPLPQTGAGIGTCKICMQGILSEAVEICKALEIEYEQKI
jgi:hypothetical protein